MKNWLRWLPGVQVLKQYEMAWLRPDLMAGFVLTTMLVPVGIAYAVASGVPGIMACTRPSSRCSPMRCSGRAGSWCSVRTPRWPP
jgi:hypothetical protein